MEAASLAWLPLGWTCAFVSEIEKAPCALLAQGFPDTPNFGDMNKFQEWPDAAIDVLVGGTPCQSFSIAGLRKGLADPRGSLMLVFGAIARRYRPRWIVWENVPGVLSADQGRAFGAFLGMLGELGYGFAYRILDAQYFGLAQRRARVSIAYTLEARAEVQAVAFSCKDHGADAGEIAPTLRAMGHADSHANAGGQLAVAFALRGREGGAQVEIEGDGDKVGALRAAAGGSSRDYVADYAVRRLTPTECERLQGAPDGHTAIMLRGKPIADGPRYKMIGNSMAVPVMRWIGERIALVNAALTPP